MRYSEERLKNLTELHINKEFAISRGEYTPPPPGAEVIVLGQKLSYYDELRNIWDCYPDYICDDSTLWLAEEAGMSLINVGGLYHVVASGFTRLIVHADGRENPVETDVAMWSEEDPRKAIICLLLLMS